MAKKKSTGKGQQKGRIRRGSGSRDPRRAAREDPNPSEFELQVYYERMSGKTLATIAESIGSTFQLVRAIEAEVAAKLYPQTKNSIDRMRQMHTSKLEHIYDRAMQQFEESCKDELVTEDGKKETINGEMAHESTKRRKQSGNPTYLQTAMTALARIEELWSMKDHETRDTDGIPAGGPRHKMLRAWIDQQNAKLSEYEESITSTESVPTGAAV